MKRPSHVRLFHGVLDVDVGMSWLQHSLDIIQDPDGLIRKVLDDIGVTDFVCLKCCHHDLCLGGSELAKVKALVSLFQDWEFSGYNGVRVVHFPIDLFTVTHEDFLTYYRASAFYIPEQEVPIEQQPEVSPATDLATISHLTTTTASIEATTTSKVNAETKPIDNEDVLEVVVNPHGCVVDGESPHVPNQEQPTMVPSSGSSSGIISGPVLGSSGDSTPDPIIESRVLLVVPQGMTTTDDLAPDSIIDKHEPVTLIVTSSDNLTLDSIPLLVTTTEDLAPDPSGGTVPTISVSSGTTTTTSDLEPDPMDVDGGASLSSGAATVVNRMKAASTRTVLVMTLVVLLQPMFSTTVSTPLLADNLAPDPGNDMIYCSHFYSESTLCPLVPSYNALPTYEMIPSMYPTPCAMVPSNDNLRVHHDAFSFSFICPSERLHATVGFKHITGPTFGKPGHSTVSSPIYGATTGVAVSTDRSHLFCTMLELQE